MQTCRGELTIVVAAVVSQLSEVDAQNVLAGVSTAAGGEELRRLLRSLYALPDEQRAAIVQRAESVAGIQPSLRLRLDAASG
jgi:DNA-directed RNA polymerase specialized sigma24 family protein